MAKISLGILYRQAIKNLDGDKDLDTVLAEMLRLLRMSEEHTTLRDYIKERGIKDSSSLYYATKDLKPVGRIATSNYYDKKQLEKTLKEYKDNVRKQINKWKIDNIGGVKE